MTETIKSRKNVSFPSDKTALVAFQRRMRKWYAQNKRDFPWRRRRVSKYKLVVSELLLQRTKAETVAGFFSKFVNRYPSWKKIAESSESELGLILQPIGLWKRRSTSLRSLARVMVPKNGRFPRDRRELEALPGIGQYIANAILLLCHNNAQPLLDVNMARVLERVFGPRQLADIRYDPYLQNLAYQVVQCRDSKEMNWAILDLASRTCRVRNPRCCECPLLSMCITGKMRECP